MLDTIHTPLRVLLLDGHHPGALAMVRSLGRRRTRVTVASPSASAPALWSRYCADSLRCPEPQAGHPDFRRWLFATLRREPFDALLFCAPRTAEILVAQANTIRLYSGCTLPTPHLLHDLSRPWMRDKLLIARDLGELVSPESSASTAHQDYALLGLTRRGEPVAAFVHRLQRGSRGDSLPCETRRAAESLEHDGVRRAGLRALQALRWDGIATLEFRHDLERDTLSLLGIHPAWGDGMELAIACGIDLPWLWAQLAAGRPITGPTRYRVGLRFQRLFTREAGSSPRLRLHDLVAACLPSSRTDLWLRDPLPHLPLLGRMVLWLRRRSRMRRRPAPHVPPKLEVLNGGNHPAAPHVSSSIPTRAGGASP